MEDSTNEHGGRILLLLATRDAQSAEQLVANSDIPLDEVAQQLHRLTDRGFVVAGSSDADIAVYQLNPKGVRTETPPPEQRVLVVEDADGLRHLMRVVLEDEGYTVIAVAIQADAVSLLKEVSFDLVITDSFTTNARAIVVDAAELLAASGATPVALFTGHRVELASTHAAGFAALITKPVDIDVLAQQVRALLSATI